MENEDKSVSYALVKHNIVLNCCSWETEEEFKAMEELLYKDPFHPKDAVWMRVPDTNRNLAKRYIWNSEKGYFHTPQPFPSWVLDDELQAYVAPVPMPEWPWLADWDEDKLEWNIKGKHPAAKDLDELLEELE